MRCISNPVQQISPLTRDHLKHLYNHLPRPLSHDNLLFLTMLLVGFFGLLCLGELVQPNTSSLCSATKTSWRHNVCLNWTSFSFIIPQSKADMMFEGDQVDIQRAQLLLIHLWFSIGMLGLVTHCSLCSLCCGFTLMVLCLLGLGSYLGYMFSFLTLLGAIPYMLVVLHSWLLQVSLHLKFKQYGDGDQTPLSAIFINIQHCLQAVLFHGRSIHHPPFANLS